MSVRAHGESSHGPSVGSSVDLDTTKKRLDAALNDARSGGETSGEPDQPTIEALVADAEILVERATPSITTLLGTDDKKASVEETRKALVDLHTVVDEATDLLDAINLAALPDAIDFKELPTAIDTDNILTALATGDPTDAVELRRLVALVDLGTLFREVDFRALSKEKTELDEAVTNASDNLAANSDQETDTEGGLGGRLQSVYDRTEAASDGVTATTIGRGSSGTPLMHSTLPPTDRSDIHHPAHFSTMPRR